MEDIREKKKKIKVRFIPRLVSSISAPFKPRTKAGLMKAFPGPERGSAIT